MCKSNHNRRNSIHSCSLCNLFTVRKLSKPRHPLLCTFSIFAMSCFKCGDHTTQLYSSIGQTYTVNSAMSLISLCNNIVYVYWWLQITWDCKSWRVLTSSSSCNTLLTKWQNAFWHTMNLATRHNCYCRQQTTFNTQWFRHSKFAITLYVKCSIY